MQPRILIIEDTPASIELAAYLIESAGWKTLMAVDGEDGLATVRSERPDLILCDIHVPKLDGFGIVARLKADPVLHRIPIVAVTALAMVGDRERAFAAGFDGYLPKPIVPETFIESLRRFLPAAAPSPPAEATTPGLEQVPDYTHRRDGSVLIVDDQADNIALCRSILAPVVRDVRSAASMAVALDSIRRKHPDLVLCDVDMPGGGALELMEALQQEPAHDQVPVVVISSFPAAEFRALTRHLDFKPRIVLFRPLEPEALRAAILDVLALLEGGEGAT